MAQEKNSDRTATKNPDTCLFTGSELGPDTKVEHTILRSLGGRICSTRVSSSAFNEACGSRIDPYLMLPYAEVMATLRPLLSAQHKGGELEVEIPGEQGKFVIDENGQLVLKGIKVIAKDPSTGRPTSFAGADTGAVIRMAEGLKQPGQTYTMTTVPQTESPEWFRDRPVVCPETELSAIKCLLLSFDELLANQPDRRFTRSAQLQQVRDFVRKAVDTRKIDGNGMHTFSLGMQYDRLNAYAKIGASLGFSNDPFTHLVLASGNSATHTIDAVWWVLGIDPFGFRLSTTWDGSDFTCCFANRPLRGGGVDGPVWLETATSLCGPSEFRSFPDGVLTQGLGEKIMRVISVHRSDGYRQAVDLLERTGDDYLCHVLAESAALDEAGGHTLAGAVRRRLERLYRGHIVRHENLKFIALTVEREVMSLPVETRGTRVEPQQDRSKVDWRPWLNAYRSILTELRGRLGLPGYIFTQATNVVLDDVSMRDLGKLPKVPGES